MALTQQTSDQECIGDSLVTFNANFSALDTAVSLISSQLVSGIADGDKGDITVSGGGTIWNIDISAISTPKLSAECVTADKVAKGAIVQVVQTALTDVMGVVDQIAYDDHVPLVSEGAEVLSQDIVPYSASNKVLVSVKVHYGTNSTINVNIALFRGTTCIAAESTISYNQGSAVIQFLDSPATASSVTYSVRVGNSDGASLIGINARSSAAVQRLFGGVSQTTMILQEVKA